MRTPFGDLPAGYAEHASMSEQNDYLQARLSRRTFLKGVGLAGLASASPALWIQSARADGTPRVWPHVSFDADAQHAAAVNFSTARPFRRALVEYGLDDAFGSTVGVDVRSVSGVSTRYGHGLLSGLHAGTTYRYRILLDGAVTASGTVRTAAAGGEPFTFTAFGDQGVSAHAQAVIGQVGRLRPAFHLLAGDICYADPKGGGGAHDTFYPEVWDTWLQLISPIARSTPWMCTTGNHEMEPGFGPLGYSGVLDRLRLPGNGASGCPSTYVFRYGNVAFVSLDSNDVSYEIPHNLGYSQGRQTAWLDQQLTALNAAGGVDFIVVFFHHCAYSTNAAHGSEGGIREFWVPLFDKHGVDLVINGHAHLYQRSVPVRNGRVAALGPRGSRVDSSLGTTYITAGGGGASPNGGFENGGSVVVRPGGKREHEPAPWAVPTGTTDHAFLAVTVTPSRNWWEPATMQIRAIDEHGTPFDQVTLTRAPGRTAGLRPSTGTVVGAGAAAAVLTGAGLVASRRARPAVPNAAGTAGAGVQAGKKALAARKQAVATASGGSPVSADDSTSVPTATS